LHSSGSGDSHTPADDVIRWYSAHGYDFIVFTDHNRVTRPAPEFQGMLVFPGVELTQNLKSCDPEPEAGLRCLLHMNALFVSGGPDIFWPAVLPGRRIDIYGRALEVTRQMGGLALLNHPNFHYAADARVTIELARRGVTLLEIANEATDSNNQGDGRHRTTEQLWDEVLTAGFMMYGVASDDAHHYYDAQEVIAKGEKAHLGDRGFVMVRARKNPTDIRAAVEQGAFYSSNGVLLDRAEMVQGMLQVTVASHMSGRHRFRFIGKGGKVIASAEGREAAIRIDDMATGYVRVVVQDERGRKAWVQPIRVP
jgi:hypothetical protein